MKSCSTPLKVEWWREGAAVATSSSGEEMSFVLVHVVKIFLHPVCSQIRRETYRCIIVIIVRCHIFQNYIWSYC